LVIILGLIAFPFTARLVGFDAFQAAGMAIALAGCLRLALRAAQVRVS